MAKCYRPKAVRLRRVRVGARYVFQPIVLDQLTCWGVLQGLLHEGDVVRVVNLQGCPPANIMGHCYIEKDGQFCGLVSTYSLQPIQRRTSS